MSEPLYVGPLLHLRTLPAFAQLSAMQLRDLAYECEEVVLERDAELVKPGEAASAMYLIVDGFAVHGPDREVVGPGGVVGFLEVLSSGEARHRAVAETEVVALRIEADALRDVCEQNFPLLSALLAYVAGRITEEPSAIARVVAEGSGAPLSVGQLDRVGRILALQRAPALTGPHLDALAELAGRAPAIEMAKGEALWDLAGPAGRLYVVCSGTVGLGPDTGGEVRLGPGATVGLVEVLSGRPHVRVASALEPSVVLRIEAEPFIDLLEDHFEMAFDLLSWLTRQLTALPSSHTRQG